MYEVKKSIFLNLSKNQKSALCNYLKAFVKKNFELVTDEIFQKFYDDEKYYLEMNSSRFEFLEDLLDDDDFVCDAKKYINECHLYFENKKKQEPIIQAQRAYEKKKREFLKQVKMQHEKPTKKQLYYYDALCKKYGIEKEDTENMSKFDIKEKISGIIDEHKADYEYFN